MFMLKVNGRELAILGEMIESGKITPVIDKMYPLSGTADAIRYVEDEHARGKVVITVAAESVAAE